MSEKSEKKKSVKRHDIGVATCRRLLQEGSGVDRVSKDAAVLAGQCVEELLSRTGEKCKEELELRKRKTVDVECVERAMVGKCNGITKKGMMDKGHKNVSKTRGLAEAGVERIVRKKLGKDHRISEDAKKHMVRGADQYLKSLAMRAGELASHSKRATILEKDVQSAAHMLTEE